MKRMTLLDAQVGIGNILEPLTPGEQVSMPNAQPLGVNTLSITSMEATYAPHNIQTILEAAICPETGDGSLLIPAIFSSNLQACKLNLQNSDYYEIQNFLKKDLEPLLENQALLQMYVNLMIEG